MRGKSLKYIPVKGAKYRDWTVCSNDIVKSDKNRSTYWKVQCKCGKIETRIAHHLVNGKSGSCKSCAAVRTPMIERYFNRMKDRANRKNRQPIEFKITVKYIKKLIENQNYKCNLSGLDIVIPKYHSEYQDGLMTASLDRIDSSKGYVENNLQWVHKDINFMKGILSQERFIDLCGKVFQNADR